MEKLSMVLLFTTLMAKDNLAFVPLESIQEFCNYWSDTPIFEELALETKCTNFVFSDGKQLCLIRPSDQDLFETKTCRNYKDLLRVVQKRMLGITSSLLSETELKQSFCNKIYSKPGYLQVRNLCPHLVKRLSLNKICLINVEDHLIDFETCHDIAEVSVAKKTTRLLPTTILQQIVKETTEPHFEKFMFEPSSTTQSTWNEEIDTSDVTVSATKIDSQQQTFLQQIQEWFLQAWDELLVFLSVLRLICFDQYAGTKMANRWNIPRNKTNRICVILAILLTHLANKFNNSSSETPENETAMDRLNESGLRLNGSESEGDQTDNNTSTPSTATTEHGSTFISRIVDSMRRSDRRHSTAIGSPGLNIIKEPSKKR